MKHRKALVFFICIEVEGAAAGYDEVRKALLRRAWADTLAPQSKGMEVQAVFVLSMIFTPPMSDGGKVFSGLIVQLYVQICLL